MKEIKRWTAVLAMLALVLTTLFTGIIAAAPPGEGQAAEEQSLEAPAEIPEVAPEGEEPAGEEPAGEEPSPDEEPAGEEPSPDEELGAGAEDPVEEPEIIDEEQGESALPDEGLEETETLDEDPAQDELGAGMEPDANLMTQLPQDVEVLCCPKGKICVIKFEDKNCNGVMDWDESGLGGVEITLTKGCNTWKKTTPNHGQNKGRVCFDNLQLGTYTVSEGGKNGFYATTSTSMQVTLTECDKDQTVFFGNARGLSISGSKFKDENCNGEWDRREDGLWGVTIVLSGGGIELFEKTDWKGRYRFEGLQPGTYTVSEVVPCGYYQTYPESGSHVVTLGCGEDACGIDFGNAPCGRILGMKWEDRDCSGGLSCGDRPMAGVEIQLWQGGELVDTAVTCKLGTYMFDTCLEPGTYTVSEVVPCDYYPSFPCGGTYTVNLCCGEWKVLCFFNAPAGSISGYKFWDKNCNGEWDDGEPPMEGVTICLQQGGNDTVVFGGNGNSNGNCTQTDSNGWYGFENLPPGYYQVSEQPPKGFYPTTPNPVWVELCCGEDYGPVNFGNAKYGSICGTKYLDLDGDGNWDEGEPGIPGVTVCLSVEDGNGAEEKAQEVNGNGAAWCTVTDEEGHYCFQGLLPGGYTVEVDESTVPPGHYASTPNPVTLELGCGEDAEVLFGNAPYVDISGNKWEDLNCNGVKDTGEPAVGGVKIVLLNSEDAEIASTTTGADGSYSFTDLKPGVYTVKEALTELQLAAWFPVSPQEGIHKEVKLLDGEDVEGLDFFNCRYGKLSGTKWVDDGDELLDKSKDKPLQGITIILTGKTLLGMDVSYKTVTDAKGEYAFSGLVPGSYTVQELYDTTKMKPIGSDTVKKDIASGGDLTVDFLNSEITVAGEVITPPVQPEVRGEVTLPATGLNQLPLLLFAGLLVLLGLMALMLGILKLRHS